MPIVTRAGESFGLLSLNDRVDGTPFNERHQRLAEALGHYAAVALKRTRLTTDLRGSEERFRLSFKTPPTSSRSWITGSDPLRNAVNRNDSRLQGR